MPGADVPIADLVMHPVRMRIIQQVAGREVTTTALKQDLPAIAPATLYRHVAALIEGGILTVVREERVRGAVERTLALGERFPRVERDEGAAMTTEQHRRLFTLFLANLATDFDRLAERGALGSDPAFGYSQAALYASADDLARLQEGFRALLEPLLTEDYSDGKRRLLFTSVLIPDE